MSTTDNTAITNEISVDVLKAAILFVAKNDTREYLNQVRIMDGSVFATNGHYMFKCDIPNLNKELNMLIPVSVIKSLSKSVDKKSLNFVSIKIENDVAFLTLNRHTETFVYSEPSKSLINYNRVMEFGEETIAEIPFMNYEYVYNMQKANKILGGRDIKLKLTGGEDFPIIKIVFDTERFNAVGKLMPIKR